VIDETDIRGMLDAADTPPPGVRLDTVLAHGRRAVIRRRIGSAAGGTALALTLTAAVAVPMMLRHTETTRGVTPGVAPATHASAPATHASTTPTVKGGTLGSDPGPATTKTCSISELPLPAGVPKNFEPEYVDPTGAYILAFQASNIVYRTVLWHNGVPRVLNLPGPMGQAVGVNEQGVVVGVSGVGGHERLFRWVNGQITYLTVPMAGDWKFYETYIGPDGTIVSQVELAGNSGGGTDASMRWAPGASMAVKMPMSSQARIMGVLADGRIVADSSAATGNGYGWIFDPTGTHGTKLQTPAGGGSYAGNGVGNLVAGSVFIPGVLRGVATMWNADTGVGTQYPDVVMIEGLDAQGDILTFSRTVRLADGTMASLPTLKSGQAVDAHVMAANGLVIGDVRNAGVSGAPETPVVWHC
jgi:hypothetical protein